ncbi:hypothetical protein LWF15_28930 [Kineosporia rhizophila]|uniref:hypothetical protein n=1 Tax=Kineosporia rhizophila TaxID=84633 RepID=UPI001E3C7782|nr:hypothetical protein [Kineosporia rhizophila]MCE0539531.1 hypothetical protein [Kineosporia rhizophila]
MNIQRVETVLGMLRPLRNRPEEHVQLSELMGEELMGAVDVLRERCAHPHTHPDDRVDLLALLGTTLVDVAWEIRGSGPASSVRKSAWPDFREILTEADEILVAALRMVPHHPDAATFRLFTALGLGVRSDEWWNRFEVARAAHPTLYAAHRAMLTALCAKWYGSDELMFDFGRSVAEQAPPGDPLVAMLPLAHAEYLCSVMMGRNTPGGPSPEAARMDDEEAVMAASWKWAGDGSRPAPTHAHALRAHNLFGWFLGTSSRFQDRGRWHLEQTRHRYHSMPWSFVADDPQGAYAELCVRLGVR